MASGNTLRTFTASDVRSPATNYATVNARNNHLVLDFDDTTGETAYFEDVLPRSYAGGGITVYVHWASKTAIAGTVGWFIAIERIGTAQDLDADSFAADQTITAATTSGTSGILIITNVAITDGASMDSLAVGESFRIRVTRDVAADTVVGDAQLFAVEIKET